MAWHDRQNRETTACRRLGRDCTCNPLRGGAQSPAHCSKQESARANLRQEAEICITGYVRELGDQPSAASELAVRRLQMLDDVAQALCHAVQMLRNGKRRASRFLPTVGDERTSLGLERWGGHWVNHWTAFLQWPCRATQGGLGGREAGTAAWTASWTSQRVLPQHHRLDGQGGDIAKIICNLLLVLIWRRNLKFLFRTSASGPQQQQSWFSIYAPASQEHHMMLQHAVSPFSAF